MAASDPVLERIATYPWPRGGLQARRVRMRPLPSSDSFEVLWWRRDAWGPAGPFGAVLLLDDALAFIADKPAFWIRA